MRTKSRPHNLVFLKFLWPRTRKTFSRSKTTTIFLCPELIDRPKLPELYQALVLPSMRKNAGILLTSAPNPLILPDSLTRPQPGYNL